MKKGTQQSAIWSSLLLCWYTSRSPQSKVIEENVLLPDASYLHNNILSYPPLANIMCFKKQIEFKIFQVSGKPQNLWMYHSQMSELTDTPWTAILPGLYNEYLWIPQQSISTVQLLSRVQLFAIPWTVERQNSRSITKSWSLLKLMSIESVIPSNHLILCHPLLLPTSIFLASGSFPVSQFFASGGQSIGVSASVSVLPRNIQDCFPFGLTDWKSVTVSIVSASICHEVMGPDAMILVFWSWVLSQLFHSPLSLSLRGSLVLCFLP